MEPRVTLRGSACDGAAVLLVAAKSRVGAPAFEIPALRKESEGRGTHCVGDRQLPPYWLMSVSIFRLPGLTCGRDHHGGEIAFCRELAERIQIMALQIIPAAEQLTALPLQLFEFKLLGFGGS